MDKLTGEPKASTLTVEAGSSEAERAVLYLAACPPAVSGEGGRDATFSIVCRVAELFPSLRDEDALTDAIEAWNERRDPPWSDK